MAQSFKMFWNVEWKKWCVSREKELTGWAAALLGKMQQLRGMPSWTWSNRVFLSHMKQTAVVKTWLHKEKHALLPLSSAREDKQIKNQIWFAIWTKLLSKKTTCLNGLKLSHVFSNISNLLSVFLMPQHKALSKMFIGYTSVSCHRIDDFVLYAIFYATQIAKNQPNKKWTYQNWDCEWCVKCKEKSFLSVRHAGVPVMQRQGKDLCD